MPPRFIIFGFLHHRPVYKFRPPPPPLTALQFFQLISLQCFDNITGTPITSCKTAHYNEETPGERLSNA
jgi:hypothetical protein